MSIREKLLDKGFAPDQVNEIEEGIKAGLDVAVYTKKDYLAIQMRQIRFGLMDGLAVEKYASKDYDWFQMEEIRKGLKAGIKVESYASPDVPYDTMREIRKGLSENLDLSRYRDMDAGVLREFRKGLASNVNIVKYIKQGYDTEQLREIRLAMEEGENIDPYLNKEFRGAAISEIRKGLARGLNVSSYARTNYNWQQMREIRKGLENRVDISVYENAYYSWQQMREIRKGLEYGIDVTKYKSLMYTAAEMKKKRLMLQKDGVFEDVEIRKLCEIIEGKEYREDTAIIVSDNEMEAYIELRDAGGDISRTEITEALQRSGVCEGILEDVIESIVKGKYRDRKKKILIAKGRLPVNGKDGWYEYFFKTRSSPKLLPDGSVDYQNTQWFDMVEQGQKIAFYHDAGKGVNGCTVLGRTLPAKKGKEMSMLAGKGFVLMPDQKTYLSAENGKVELINGRLEVTKLLILDEMTIATGKVDFDGSVYIKGSVGSGVMIRALEDIIIDGFVEAANIECGGSVILRKGMNAAGNGMIRAGKNVTGKFFEAVRIFSGGDIQANSVLNCELYAEGEVVINGSTGTLVGGLTHASKGLKASNIGNHIALPTYVKIGLHDRMLHEQHRISEKIKEVKKEMSILHNAYVDFRKKYPAEVRNTMELYLKIESAIFTKEKQLDELEFSNVEVGNKINASEDVKMMVSGTLFDGVTVEVGGTKWLSKNLQNVTLKKINNRIAIYSNN